MDFRKKLNQVYWLSGLLVYYSFKALKGRDTLALGNRPMK
jgi:hypothetical protein